MCLGREPQTYHQPRRYDCRLDDNMTLQIEPRHDLSPNEIDAIEDRIYDHNSYATGRHDRQDLGNPQRGGTDDRRRRWLYVVRHF